LKPYTKNKLIKTFTFAATLPAVGFFVTPSIVLIFLPVLPAPPLHAATLSAFFIILARFSVALNDDEDPILGCLPATLIFLVPDANTVLVVVAAGAALLDAVEGAEVTAATGGLVSFVVADGV